MKKTHLFYSLIVLFFLGSIIYFLNIRGAESVEFVRSLDADAEYFERNYKSYDLHDQYIITDTTRIYRPSVMKKTGNRIYMVDFYNFWIYEYDMDGKETGKIEMNQGQGPGEFQHLTDFDVIGETLWTVDHQNMMISSFSLKTGELLSSIAVDRMPARIACLENGFIIKWFSAEFLFSKYDYEGNEIRRFGKIIEDQTLHALSLDGNILSNRKDRFVFIPLYASLIYQYGSDGSLINVLKAPDGLEFPVTRREGNMAFAPDFTFYRNGYLNDKDLLYVNTWLPGGQNGPGQWDGEPVSVIDKYNLRTSDYETSLQLPFMNHFVLFIDNTNTFFTSNYENGFFYQLNEDLDF